MRTNGGNNSFEIVEDIPQSLGIATAVRKMRGMSLMPPLPDVVTIEPESAVHDEASWQQWWSFLVTARSPGYTIPVSGDAFERMAGDEWTEARDYFSTQLLGIVQSLREKQMSESDTWHELRVVETFSGRFALDVVPGDFPLSHQVAPHYWLLSVQSRLDDAVISEILRREVSSTAT